MKSLAIAIKKLELNQEKLFLLTSINKLVHDYGIDCAIFHHEFGVPFMPSLAAMYQIVEMWDFEGTVITTDFSIAKQLINCPGPRKKFFYVWDFIWTHMEQFNYNTIADVYCNDSIELIARSNDHAKVLSDCFKQPSYVLEDWRACDLEKIIE